MSRCGAPGYAFSGVPLQQVPLRPGGHCGRQARAPRGTILEWRVPSPAQRRLTARSVVDIGDAAVFAGVSVRVAADNAY